MRAYVTWNTQLHDPRMNPKQGRKAHARKKAISGDDRKIQLTSESLARKKMIQLLKHPAMLVIIKNK